MTREQLAVQFKSQADHKMYLGETKYGPFLPETDKRTLTNEALSEILDLYNYVVRMLPMKHPEMKGKVRDFKPQLFRVYEQLHELRQTEKRLEREKKVVTDAVSV